MAANVTVTGKIGPGNSLTTKLFTGCISFEVFPDEGKLKLVESDNRVVWIDIATQNTFTVTISGTTYTVAISTV